MFLWVYRGHGYCDWGSAALAVARIHLHLQGKGKYYLETPDMKECLNLKRPISEHTAQRWMHKMGYWWKKEPKGQTRVWDSDGTEADHSACRESRRSRRVVIWCHDETIFYANDRRHLRWVHKDESAKPYTKGEGASVMFTDFVSPDYGWLRSQDGYVNPIIGVTEGVRITWKPGKNRDGYFTTEDVLEQATRAMDILNKHYPDEDHIFVYDNATTHFARRPDALSACKMPMNPLKDKNFLCEIKNLNTNSKTFICMQDGQFTDGTPHVFYDEHGWFKGMRRIIEECVDMGARIPDPRESRLLAQCPKFKCPPGRKDCCCRRILYSEPDFVSQKSMLEEHCTVCGFWVLLLPKFHCEPNFIEQCWGYVKRVYREFPETSAEMDLIANGLAALNSVPLVTMHRFSIRLQRFMDAYRRGLTRSQAAWASKRCRGHWTLPESILDELEAANVA
ncbi:hypothetical protein OE88DRAFT_1714535 [Heliocybe sulcata]|uniref:Uncharacterized protein n=1 Tax=Heliocybe sulcata TaxID=5364 RepID=A0A5C3MU66_9AGAM|nr:hypothetical protein OE88DRAFT_1714535 [Heliocybe sulcata]